MYVCYSWFKVIYSTHMLQPWKHLYNQCHMVANLLESSEPLLKQEWPPCSPRKVPFLVDTDSPVQPLKLLLNNQPVSPSHGCSTLRWLNSTNTTVRGSRHIMLQNKLPALLQKYTWKCKAYSIYNVHIEELNTHTHQQQTWEVSNSLQTWCTSDKDVADCFYVVLFSALQQTHCTLVACDSQWVTSFLLFIGISKFWISTQVMYLQLGPCETAAISMHSHDSVCTIHPYTMPCHFIIHAKPHTWGLFCY